MARHIASTHNQIKSLLEERFRQLMPQSGNSGQLGIEGQTLPDDSADLGLKSLPPPLPGGSSDHSIQSLLPPTDHSDQSQPLRVHSDHRTDHGTQPQPSLVHSASGQPDIHPRPPCFSSETDVFTSTENRTQVK